MDQQGYLSLEFIFTLLVMTVLVGTMVTLTSERMDRAMENEKLSEARFLVEYVASAINKVNSAGNGHEIRITMPPKVGNSSYLLWLNSSGVYIEFEGKKR